MGLFLDLSGVIGNNETDIVSSLKNYLNSVGGGLERADIDSRHKNFCAVEWVKVVMLQFFFRHILPLGKNVPYLFQRI